MSQLNKDYILYNLGEAAEELLRTIEDIKNRPDYEIGEYSVAMSHLYHHLNTAWNARRVSEQQAEACTDQDFQSWRQFPTDILL